MPRAAPDDVFSSSPAHPSHARAAAAQKPTERKRKATVAALLSPPSTVRNPNKRLRSSRSSVSSSRDGLGSSGEESDDARSRSPLSHTRSRHSTHAQEFPSVKSRSSGASVSSRASLRSQTPEDSPEPERYSSASSGASPRFGELALDHPVHRKPISTASSVGSSLGKSEAEVELELTGPPGIISSSWDSSDEDEVAPTVKRTRDSVSPLSKIEPPKPVKRKHALSDSPANPFLCNSPRKPRPNVTKTLAERDTVDYVFRGVKSTIPNPFKKAKLRPGQVDPSTLDPSHIDFEPDEAFWGTPKLLFPSGPTTPKRERSPSQTRSDTYESLPSIRRSGIKPVNRKLFADELAETSNERRETPPRAAKANAASAIIGQAHGPIRPGGGGLAGVLGGRQQSFTAGSTKKSTNTGTKRL